MADIREHMKIIGKDGADVGTGTMYSRIRWFGSADAVVLDPPDAARSCHERGQPPASTARRFAINRVGYPTIQRVAR